MKWDFMLFLIACVFSTGIEEVLSDEPEFVYKPDPTPELRNFDESKFSNVYIAHLKLFPSFTFLCFASFISRYHLLTAASCFKGLLINETLIQYFTESQTPLLAATTEVFYPPKVENLAGDVAVVRLYRVIPESYIFSLPINGMYDLKKRITTLSWADRQNLTKGVELNLIESFSRNPCSSWTKNLTMDESCFIGLKVPKYDIDRGAPAVVVKKTEDNKMVGMIVGIFTAHKTNQTNLAIYQFLELYVPWINNIVATKKLDYDI